MVVHAKGLITGPYRPQRVRAVLRALVLVPAFARSRPSVAAPALVASDLGLFAYSAGQAPLFDAETYRAGPRPE